MKLTAYKPEHKDCDGKTLFPEFNSEWEPPILADDFSSDGLCFVIYKNWLGKYQIREEKVIEYWFTNIWGWRLSNGWCIIADEYGKTIFRHDELQKAIEICEKKNRMKKVKVKYL